MSQAFTLLQLSDSHLSADSAAQYRGQNADASLLSLLPACRLLAPDGVVLTGDVAEDGSAEAYRRAVEMIAGLAPRTAWIPGNHDDRGRMAEVLGGAGFEAGPVLEWGGWRIALLNSAVPNRPEGHLDEERLAPLASLLADGPALVFVHHQPVAVDSPWIDKYPLIEPEQLWARMNPETVRAVAFGHVHQAFSGEKNGIACLSAPSTVANSQPGMARFTLDPTGPKARWFRLWPDGRWFSGIVSAG
ncbi:MAG: metallophosphoesterase [Wenzhouxiangella sp.]|jgi:Icc protein|nr:metallophosphoesterase [Wenzhouxiangella sp.]